MRYDYQPSKTQPEPEDWVISFPATAIEPPKEIFLQSAERTTRVACGPLTGAVLSLLAFGILLGALDVQLPLWFHCTQFGALFGTLILTGWMLGSVGHGRCTSALLGIVCATLSHWALDSMSSLNNFEQTLLVAIVIGVGWLPSRFIFTKPRTCQTVCQTRTGIRTQLSIFDVIVLTTLVAAILAGVRGLQTAPIMLLQIGWVVAAGCTASGLAWTWVMRDRWTPVQLALFLLALVGLVLIAAQYAPAGLHAGQTMRWLLTGPFSVIIAQTMTVTVVLSAARVDEWLVRQ